MKYKNYIDCPLDNAHGGASKSVIERRVFFVDDELFVHDAFETRAIEDGKF